MTREARPPISPVVLVKGAGEMASAVAWRLYRANIRRLCMTDLPRPLAVRRTVSFCRAIEEGEAVVEGVAAGRARNGAEVRRLWSEGRIAVLTVEDWARVADPRPDAVVDAILAKRNLGTGLDDAPLVVALGPGFVAGRDAHFVVETDRGHDLGRIIERGETAPDTGVPGTIAGESVARVIRAPKAGTFRRRRRIGDRVRRGEVVGEIDGEPVAAGLDGILRGLVGDGTPVPEGLKLGDVDPRGEEAYCRTVSDKARAISGSVLECLLRHFNRPDRGA